MQLTTDPRTLGYTRAITTQAVAADTEVLSDAIDMTGWTHMVLLVNGGANAATSGSVTIVLQESATDSGTYTDVTGTEVTLATTDDNKFVTGLLKSSALTVGPFVKVSITGGTGGTFTCGAEVILLNAKDSGVFTAALAAAGSGDVVALSFDVN